MARMPDKNVNEGGAIFTLQIDSEASCFQSFAKAALLVCLGRRCAPFEVKQTIVEMSRI